MKTELLSFKRPKLVLQVFQKIIIYYQDQKSFETRKEYSGWKDEVDSTSGILKENRLLLSKEYESENLHSCDLIVLNDYTIPALHPEPPVQFFNLQSRNLKLGIFRLRNFSEEIELYLEYNDFNVGVPKRENFKLCNLEIKVPIEVKINGKFDATLSSGRERMFMEQHFIFHLHGDIKEVELCREPFGLFPKPVPAPEKVVDLMKNLW